MTASLLLAWCRYRYFPYEREFARREVKALFGATPSETDEGFIVPLIPNMVPTIERLTYVRAAINGTGLVGIPIQALLEGSAMALRPNGTGPRVLQRQQTRYSAHGLHEYRGKYNPQVVRVLGNIFDLGPRAWVLDPFCGSGTTLLECTHNGWNAVGIDANPLAVLIANAKVAAIREIDHGLVDCVERTLDRITARAGEVSHDRAVSAATLDSVAGAGWRAALPNSQYLTQWFPMPVLAQAAVALQEIAKMRRDGHRAVLRTLLSDMLRDVSYQDPSDLRIRRREKPAANYALVTILAAVARDRLERVERARNELRLGRFAQHAYCGDSREWLRNATQQRPRALHRRFDAVITSPPYANALPYIDTQRLSLCLLGLASASDLRPTEAGLIGNREISRAERDAGAVEVERNTARLPDTVARLCREMLTASLGIENGFRRQNTPCLVYRYFRDMARVFAGLRDRMKNEAPVALLVGKNRTTLGGNEFVIDTPTLLGDVACHAGLRFTELVKLDAYFRFGMHQRNSIRDEALLLLRR